VPANLIIPLTQVDYDNIVNSTESFVIAAKADALFVFDAATPAVEIHGEFRDLGQSANRRNFRDKLSATLREPEASIEQFGTPAYKLLTEQRRDQARTSLSNVAPPIVGVPPLPPPHGVTGDMNAVQGAEHMLDNGGGMVLGYDHKDQASKDYTTELIRQHGGTKLKHLFVEELASDLQDEIDAFLSDPAAEMPAMLLTRIKELQDSSYKADFEGMLYAAREQGVRIWGIDTTKADPQVKTDDPRYHERRLALMNAEAKRVFDHVQANFAGEPFVALTGQMHVNTADGGVPGLAQIMGVPGFTLEPDSKKLAFIPEDTSKRSGLNALEHACSEAILKKAGTEYATFLATYRTLPAYTNLPDPKPQLNVKLNLPEATVIAQRLAQQFSAGGQLTQPTDIATLLADPAVTTALSTLFQATVIRDDRRKKLVQAVKDGDLGVVQSALNADPYLAKMPGDDTLKDSLLHTACGAGQPGIVQELLARGVNPNAIDLKGRAPLHMALGPREGTPPSATDLGSVVGHLLGGGANAGLADPGGNTGLSLAKAGPLAGGEVVGAFVTAGQAPASDIFVTRFVAEAVRQYTAVKAMGGAQADEDEARAAALALVGTLPTKGVPLGTAGEVDTAMGHGDTTGELARLIVLWQARAQRKADVVTAIKAKDLAGLQAALNADPRLAHIPIDSNKHMALGLAALEGDKAALAELITARGVDVDQKNPTGRTALHEVLSQQTSKTDRVAQEGVRDKALNLISTHGADVNARNGRGETALHLAGFRNNTPMIKALADRLGSDNSIDPEIRDDRGWTALDTTLGSTNREAEDLLHAEGLGGKKPPLKPGKLSTVDILAQSTRCQDPADELKARKFIEKLYANEALRPMLDLAAAASCNDRNPPDGGLRLFASKTNVVGPLYGQSIGSTAAYDEKVNTLLFPLGDDPGEGKEGDAVGSLAHELTHLTAHLVSNDRATLPFTDDNEKRQYLAAIDGDMRKLHLLDEKDPVQKFIKDRFSGRMDSYKDKPGSKTPKTGPEFDESLLQEFIVGVPQVAAVYGMEELEKHMPGLVGYFRDVWTPKVLETLDNDPRFANGRAKLDGPANLRSAQSLQDHPRRQLTKVDAITIKKDAPQLNIDTLMAKIETGVVATKGRLKPLQPGQPTINYKSTGYELDPADRREFDKNRAAIQQAVLQALQGENMPPDLDLAEVRELIESISDAVSNQPAKDWKTIVANRAANWVKQAKLAYVDRRIAGKYKVSAEDAAQAIIYRAEAEARGGGPGADLDPDTEVKASKQKEAIKKLSEALGKPENANKLKDPGTLIQTMTATLVGGDRKTAGFYQKPGAKAKHVSLNVDRAKRLWLAKLSTM